MEIIDGDKTRCDRCEDVIPLADASALEKEHSVDLEKTLCEECLRAVGVPRGYVVERDLTYLER